MAQGCLVVVEKGKRRNLPRKTYFPAKSFWHSRIPIIIHLIFFLLFVVACSSADPPIQCAAQSSEAALPPTEDAACVCVDNWTGPECRVSQIVRQRMRGYIFFAFRCDRE